MESKIVFSEFDALLEFLINSQVVPVMKDKIIIDLVRIKAIVIDPPQELVEDGKLQVAENAVRKVGSIFSSFDLNKMNEYMSLELCVQLHIFLELEENWPDLYRMYVVRTKLSPYYPNTSAFVFINHLLENLEELLKDTPSSTHPFNYLITRVQRELQFWYSDLIEISSNPPLFLKKLIQTITELAYDTEYVIDSFLVGDVHFWLCILWLHDILEEFEQIEQERMTAEDKEENFKANKTTINDMLLGREEQLNIITIVGPGQASKGRKSFANELYNSPSVINHFDSRVCCSLASYYYNDERIPLLMLLDHLVGLSDIIRSKSNDELCNQVYEYLKGKRFLIVINNVDYIENWVRIRRCFPDSHNGSRIVLTTHVRELAKPLNIVQPQSPLNAKFRELLFQKVNFPTEMFEVGIKIAKRCKPESMTRVLLLLQNIPETKNHWEEVAQTLGSRVFGWAGSQEERILDLTCIYLPDHLRSCFFYMGVFVWYNDVQVSELIPFLIAEGFVKHTASQSLESTAEDYIEDLIARNLMVIQKRIGRENICDLPVRKFLERKVREDNFVQLEYCTNPNYSSSPTIYYQRRLVIHAKWDDFEMLKPFGPFVHSLFSLCDWRVDDSHDISIIYKNFKFLRILHFDKIIGESITEIGVLVLLRYLSVQSSVNFVPPSIANLQYLETFIFKQSESKVVKVPDCIWDMTKLRQFDIKSSFSSFDLVPLRLENSSSILHNLQTFSKPALAYGDDMEMLLRKLLGLRVLVCVFLYSWNDATNCNRFPMLVFLNKLISLTVHYKGEGKYPCEFNFPPNLKKLTLFNFRMPWNEISQISMLNNLEVLVLMNDAFEGERWEMENHVVFPKLKYLVLMSIQVEYWSANHYQFPHLEDLLVNGCYNLVEIPQDFAYISTLRRIEVNFCTRFAEISVRLIQEQHMKHWGHDELKISCGSIYSKSEGESESESESEIE